MKSRVSGFSCGVLKARTILLAIWIARYWPMKDFWLALKACLGIVSEFGGILYADHMIFDPCHPLYRASTDALTCASGSSF